MITRSYKIYQDLLSRYLDGMITISNPRKKFFIQTIALFLSIHGRINFLQLARYSNNCEQMYRKQFDLPFDFMTLNTRFIQDTISNDRALAFDPSFIQKSGKKTPGLGRYWSGCAQTTKWGLEFCGIAALDLQAKTAFHIEAVQTDKSKKESLTDHYANMIISRDKQLLSISSLLTVDAWFYKKKFCDAVIDKGFSVITRARSNSAFRYYYVGERTGKRGRPKTYDKNVDLTLLDLNHFNLVDDLDTEKEKVYEAIVHSNALKRKVKLLVVEMKDCKKRKVLYVSTDETLNAKKIYELYHTRFQIEFLYRDGKQHTGLNSCQARSKSKLHMHVNLSLTSINVAKAVHHMEDGKYKQQPFSMSDIKQRNYNRSFLEIVFSKFSVRTKLRKNKKLMTELDSYGCKVA